MYKRQDYVQLGEATADMVAEILCDGKSATEMPYQTFDNGIVTINTETAAALGFEGDKPVSYTHLPKNIAALKRDLGKYRIDYDVWFHESLSLIHI